MTRVGASSKRQALIDWEVILVDSRISATPAAKATPAPAARGADAGPATVSSTRPADGLARNGAFFDGVSAGHRVTWTQKDLAATPVGATLPSYSLLRVQRDQIMQPPEEGDIAAGGEVSVTARMRSLVGNLLAFEQTSAGYVEGAAHPWADTTLQTVDVKSGKPVSLRDLYDAATIYQALMKDPAVRKALGSERPKDLEALLECLADRGSDDGMYTFSRDMLDHFALHHVEGKQVAVRVALPYGTEAARGTLTELGLLLPVPKGLEAAVAAAAARKEGILTPALTRAAGGKQTEMEFVVPSSD